MIEKVKAIINRYNMLSSDDRVAVAFSGGADSSALLCMMREMGIDVCAIHVNHMIRGEEADRDEKFCRDFCKERNIPFFCHRVNVPAEAKKSGIGLEEAARKLRYAVIEATVRAEGIDKVVTAHHADDNAETLIFNLARGSGIRGAGGIPPVRDIYVRPLLCLSRDEILDYCRKNEIPFVTDSTNADTDYTRNFIRHKIIPAIRELNPGYADAFFRFTQEARRDNEYIEDIADSFSENTSRQTLASLSDAVLSRYIRKRSEKFSLVPTAKVTEAVMRAVRQGSDYLRIDMGMGVVAVCDRNSLVFRRKNTKPSLNGGILKIGKNFIDGFYMNVLGKVPEKRDSVSVLLKAESITGTLRVRYRMQGDEYRMGGMTKSLKKLFNEKKIPVEQREALPLICDDTGILWIPGMPASDRARINNKEIKEDLKYIYIGYAKEED